MHELPTPLLPLEENRRELLTTLQLLNEQLDPIVRADLASELVGVCARYEDVMERAVYPVLRSISVDTSEVDRAESDQLAVRAALTEVRHRTQHVKPSNAHADDPEGFERDLERMVLVIQAHVDHEDATLFPPLADLDSKSSEKLRSDVEHAVAHASTHPNPPHNLIARAVVNVEEWLEREIHDEATSWHPGLERLHEELSSTAAKESGQEHKANDD